MTGDTELAPLPEARRTLEHMAERYPALAGTLPTLEQAYQILRRCFANDGTLFVCGNGGSMSDAIHISGELNKSFKRTRPIPLEHYERLKPYSNGYDLGSYLQRGLRTVVLGINPALSSAIDNDFPLSHMGLAQELYALARPGDVFMGLSTSGNARNVNYAVGVAHMLGLPVIGMSGEPGGRLAENADVIIQAPAGEPAEVQAYHVILYHTLCEMLEITFF